MLGVTVVMATGHVVPPDQMGRAELGTSVLSKLLS